MDPAASGLPGLADATYLATCSTAERGVDTPEKVRIAAAYQIAIWHFTSGLPLTHATVPDRRILRASRTLAARAEQSAPHRSCPIPGEPTPDANGFSTAAYEPSISLQSDAGILEPASSRSNSGERFGEPVPRPRRSRLRSGSTACRPLCAPGENRRSTRGPKARFRPIPSDCAKVRGRPLLQYRVSRTSNLVDVDRDDATTSETSR